MKKIIIYILIIIPVLSLVFMQETIAKKNIMDISEEFKGKEYINSPLGEGYGLDTDPLYRFDKFDCLTYVETVLALYFSNSDDDFKNVINNIRYKDGNVSFETRLHFQNPDWVKNNNIYLTDISSTLSNQILKKPASVSIINLDRKGWFKKTHNIDVNIPVEKVTLDYISFDDLKNNIEKFTDYINKPYIFMTVINDKSLKEKIGTEIDISHTGFIIKKDGKLFVRHASSKNKKVVDEDFLTYITNLSKNKKYLGFSFLKINL